MRGQRFDGSLPANRGTIRDPSDVGGDVAGTPLRLVVLGDSIAYGTGARHPDDSLGPRLAAVLADDGFDVDRHVLAVPGAVSAQLGPQVRRAESLRPDLAIVVIGANDLARFVPVDQAAAHLAAAVTALRAAGATVVVVPAPDMSSIPFVPPAFRAAVRAASAQLQQHQSRVAEAAGATVAHIAVDIGAAFALDPALFAADRFHPSSAGYAAIAAALTPFVLEAARERRDAAA